VPEQCQPGDWVAVHRVVLPASDRSPDVPPDTRSVPLEMWVRGFALESKAIGQQCRIRTVTGRVVEGELWEINPGYSHSFGCAVPELQGIGMELRALLREALARGQGSIVCGSDGAPEGDHAEGAGH